MIIQLADHIATIRNYCAEYGFGITDDGYLVAKSGKQLTTMVEETRKGFKVSSATTGKLFTFSSPVDIQEFLIKYYYAEKV